VTGKGRSRYRFMQGRRPRARGRSPYQVRPFTPDSFTAPLVRVLDSAGRPIGGLGAIHRPGIQFLIGPTNAGALATDSSGAFYFAPLARDEIASTTRPAGACGPPRAASLPASGTPCSAPRRQEPAARAAVGTWRFVIGPGGPPLRPRLDEFAATRCAWTCSTRHPADPRDAPPPRPRDDGRVDARGALALFERRLAARHRCANGTPALHASLCAPRPARDTVPLARFAGG